MNRGRLILVVALGLGAMVVLLASLLVRSSASVSTAIEDSLCVNPGDTQNCFSSVQDALRAAHRGATILVVEGTYTETLVVSKSVSLVGGWNQSLTVWDRQEYVTKLDARRGGSVIRVENGVSPTIEGFVITGGDATDVSGQGGGIQVNDGGMVTIRYNIITDNIACASLTCQGRGGGISVVSATALIAYNTIVSNTAHARVGGVGEGGGIYISAPVSSTVTGNDILTNTAVTTGSGRGGGVYADGVAQFSDNLVKGNTAGPDGSGGGIYGLHIQRIENSDIVGNAAGRGGGIFLDRVNQAQLVQRNLIAHNQSTAAGLQADGGGGIASQSVTAEISSNVILSNAASYFGGGLLLASGSSCSVQLNTVEGNAAAYGGGVFAHSSTGVVANNLIIKNSAIARGGGLYLYADSALQVDANRILSNTVSAGEGGGICVRHNSVPVTLTNQIVAHNSALRDGAGFHASKATSISLLNNTFADNSHGDRTAGVALREESHVTVVNNIILGHTVGVSLSSDSTATLDYNSYYENLTATVGIMWGGNHLIDDPRLENRTGGDYHIRAGSPVIDAGDSSVNVPFDFESDPRPTGAGIDIGADEFRRSLFLPIVIRQEP